MEKKTVYVEFADWEGELSDDEFIQKMAEYCAAFGLDAKFDRWGQSGPVMEVTGDVDNVKVLLFEYHMSSYTEEDRLNPDTVRTVLEGVRAY